MPARKLLLLLVFMLANCGGTSGFVPQGSDDLYIPDAGSKVLLIFNHGQNPAGEVTPCWPTGGATGGAFSVPPVLTRLAADDPSIVIYALCAGLDDDTPRGLELEDDRKVACVPNSEETQEDRNQWIRVCKRQAQIRELVEAIHARNPDLPRERTFLVGTSAGAWSSLLALKAAPEIANAVIGFAPAFTGHYAEGRDTTPGGKRQRVRACHIKHLMEAPLPGLVFTFVGDPFETALTLRDLARNPDLTLLSLPRADDPNEICSGLFSTAHACASRNRFDARYRQVIARYIRCRTDDPTDRCQPEGDTVPAPGSPWTPQFPGRMGCTE